MGYFSAPPPIKDLKYWQQKLGLRPTIRGTYVDERGKRKDIFGGETTYDPEMKIDPNYGKYYSLPHDTMDALSKISIPPPLSEDVRQMIADTANEQFNKAGFNVYSGDISVPNEEKTTNFPDHPHLQGSYIDKLSEGKYHFAPDSESPGGVTETHALVPMPKFKDITWDHLGIALEETLPGHGDRKKITNDWYLQHALWDMMNNNPDEWSGQTKEFVSDFPEILQPEKLNKIFELIGMEPISTLSGAVKKEPLPPLGISSINLPGDDMSSITDMGASSLLDSAEAIDEYRDQWGKPIPYNPNYIADQNLKDVQGVSTADFHPSNINWRYGDSRVVDVRRILEENYTKERVKNFMENLSVNGQQPFKGTPPGYHDWSKFSYINKFFRDMQTQNDSLAHYLALTGPLRDRTKPLWKNEVRPPFMQKRFEVDENREDSNWKYANKWPALNQAYEGGRKNAWDWLPTYDNPYPAFAKHGSATNFYNALIDPLQKASWWQPASSRSIYNDSNYGKYLASDDPSNAVSQPFTHVTPENESSFIPYFKDWEDSVYSGVNMFRNVFKFNDEEEWEKLQSDIENREYLPYFKRELLKDE